MCGLSLLTLRLVDSRAGFHFSMGILIAVITSTVIVLFVLSYKQGHALFIIMLEYVKPCIRAGFVDN